MMDREDRWNAVDRYFGERLLGHDPVLEAAVEASRARGLPDIAVAPNQGMLLNLLARAVGARRILEVGTPGAAEGRQADHLGDGEAPLR